VKDVSTIKIEYLFTALWICRRLSHSAHLSRSCEIRKPLRNLSGASNSVLSKEVNPKDNKVKETQNHKEPTRHPKGVGRLADGLAHW
jgi:hypothetical protein